MIIAYKELRKLEIDILKAQRDLLGSKDNLLGLGFQSAISLDSLYGIEYDDFASQIARLSLWLAEHQMNVLFEQEFGASQPMLPLKDSGHIVYGVNTPFLTQHHRRIIKPPACTQQVSYH